MCLCATYEVIKLIKIHIFRIFIKKLSLAYLSVDGYNCTAKNVFTDMLSTVPTSKKVKIKLIKSGLPTLDKLLAAL